MPGADEAILNGQAAFLALAVLVAQLSSLHDLDAMHVYNAASGKQPFHRDACQTGAGSAFSKRNIVRLSDRQSM